MIKLLFLFPALLFCSPISIPDKYHSSILRVSSYLPYYSYEQMKLWGAEETDYRDIFVVADPRILYPPKIVVRRRSIDMGWTQINSQNFKYVEAEAKRLQLAGFIPPNLVLYALPRPSRLVAVDRAFTSKECLYSLRGRNYLRPQISKFRCGDDCIDSFLIYRIIIEVREKTRKKLSKAKKKRWYC